MVATRSTDQNIVDFVIGKEQVDPETISTRGWISILRTAIATLPTNYLRGFKPINQILEYQGAHGRSVPRKVGELPSLPQLKSEGDSGTNLRANAVFLCIAETGTNSFPTSSQGLADLYLKAPQKSGSRFHALGSISCGYYLLTRDSRLFHLSVQWDPMEEWGEAECRGNAPYKFWYQANLNALEVQDLESDHALDLFLTERADRETPLRMLRHLYLSVKEALSDMRAQLEHVEEKKHLIGGYLDRVGEIVR